MSLVVKNIAMVRSARKIALGQLAVAIALAIRAQRGAMATSAVQVAKARIVQLAAKTISAIFDAITLKAKIVPTSQMSKL